MQRKVVIGRAEQPPFAPLYYYYYYLVGGFQATREAFFF